jgi:hypothetical protein
MLLSPLTSAAMLMGGRGQGRRLQSHDVLANACRQAITVVAQSSDADADATCKAMVPTYNSAYGSFAGCSLNPIPASTSTCQQLTTHLTSICDALATCYPSTATGTATATATSTDSDDDANSYDDAATATATPMPSSATGPTMMSSMLDIFNATMSTAMPLLLSNRGLCADQCRAMATGGASLAAHVLTKMDSDVALQAIRGDLSGGSSGGGPAVASQVSPQQAPLFALKKRMLGEVASGLVAYSKESISCMCGQNIQWPTLANTIIGPLRQTGASSPFANWRATLGYAEQVTTTVFSDAGFCGGTCATALGIGMKLEVQALVLMGLIDLGEFQRAVRSNGRGGFGAWINGSAIMEAVPIAEDLVQNVFPCLCAMDWSALLQQTVRPMMASIMSGNVSLYEGGSSLSYLQATIGKFITTSKSCASPACRKVMSTAFSLAKTLLPSTAHTMEVTQANGSQTVDLDSTCSAAVMLKRNVRRRPGFTNYFTAHHLVWTPLCAVSLSCPPPGVSQYKLVSTRAPPGPSNATGAL